MATESLRDHLIRRGIPRCIADDLAAEGADDAEWLEEMVRTYLDADEVSRAESGGVGMIEDAIERLAKPAQPGGGATGAAGEERK